MTRPKIIAKGTCTCGHPEPEHERDHFCHACGQDVDGDGHCEVRHCTCGVSKFAASDFDVCSRRCLLQLEYAKALVA